MHPEIEKLIKLAIVNGVVTEKERAVIMKKAVTLNEDPDEVELILDGELALKERDFIKDSSKSKKEGEFKKCPACGSSIPSFTLKCPDCNHEFRNTEATKTIKEFYKELKSSKGESRHLLISNFPIPNNKEDLVEFITLAVGHSRSMSQEEKNIYFVYNSAFSYYWKPELFHKEAEIMAWQSKAGASIMKAKVLFVNDASMLNQIIFFEQQFDANKNYAQNMRFKAMLKTMPVLIAFLLFATITLVMLIIFN